MPEALIVGALCIVVGVFHGEKVAAQQNPPTQRVPARFVVTGDMVNFASPSSYMFIGWMTNANCLIQIGFDATSNILRLQRPERYLSRVGVAALFGSVSLLVDRAFSLTAHDAAHMDAARSIGSTYVALVTPNAEAEMSIWDFLLYSFDPTREPGLYLYEKPHLTYREHAFVAGAGLDTNLLIASKMADKVVRGEGHAMDLAPYLLNKLWPVSYFLDRGSYSDAAAYLRLIDEQGYEAPAYEEVSWLTAGSTLASGTFLTLAASAYHYVATGDARVTPLGLRLGELTLYWPEVTPWLNPDNLSLEARMSAGIGSLVLAEVAVDKPFWGNRGARTEFTFGGNAHLAPFDFGGEVTTGFVGFPLVVGRAALNLNRTFAVGVEGHYGRGETMQELREYPRGAGATTYLRASF